MFCCVRSLSQYMLESIVGQGICITVFNFQPLSILIKKVSQIHV